MHKQPTFVKNMAQRATPEGRNNQFLLLVGSSLQLSNTKIIIKMHLCSLCMMNIWATTSLWVHTARVQMKLPSLYIDTCKRPEYAQRKQTVASDLTCKLTWHDPLTDELLSCASLLKLELEDCMKTMERKTQRRRSVSGEPHGQQSVHTDTPTHRRACVQRTWRTCAFRQQLHRFPFFILLKVKQKAGTKWEWTDYYILPVLFPPFT